MDIPISINNDVKRILSMSANDRFFLNEISNRGILYVMGKNGKIKHIYVNDEGYKTVLVFASKDMAEYCQKEDNLVSMYEIIELPVKDFLFEVLPKIEKKKMFVNICSNLVNSVEIPAKELRIEWVLHMLYELNLDWMFEV